MNLLRNSVILIAQGKSRIIGTLIKINATFGFYPFVDVY